jgi:hypothetical protein
MESQIILKTDYYMTICIKTVTMESTFTALVERLVTYITICERESAYEKEVKIRIRGYIQHRQNSPLKHIVI